MRKSILLLFFSLLIQKNSFGQDEIAQKTLKRYIRPSFYLDVYATGSQDIDNSKVNNLGKFAQRINKKKGTSKEEYAFSLVNFGFMLPLYTKTWESETKVNMPTFNLILTGNGLVATPKFETIDERHRLQKFGLGIRAIYTDGKRSTFFVNFSPFISQDNYTIKSPTLRYAASIVYNYTLNKYFSFRVGINKSYLLADYGYFLPFIGFRAGKLDGIYFSFQFPKNISLNFPIHKNKIYGSVFSRPIGGVFNYSNADESLSELSADAGAKLRKNQIGDDIQFRFYEILTGFLADYKVNQNFSFYVSTGFSTNRTLGFAVDRNDTFREKSKLNFNVMRSVFLNFGATITLGQARKTYNNYQMQDAFYINNSFDAGDINIGNRDLNIQNPKKEKVKSTKTSEIDYKDIKDLIYDVE